MAGVRCGERGRRWTAAVAAAALLVLAGCSGEGDAGVGAAADQPEAGEGGGGGTRTADQAVVAEVSGSTLPTLGPSVIKTARLSIEVAHDDFQQAIQDASAIAGAHGGYVLRTEVTDTEEGFGTVVLRVPAEEFELALEATQDLGAVESTTVSGEDVGEEFVDLQARLRNFEAQEAVLLRLMRKTTTIRETIDVQAELTDIQLEVERITGRLRFLEDQTSFGTITVDLHEAGAAVAKNSTLERAWARAGSVALAIVSGVIVGAGAAAPVAVLLLLAAVIYRLVRPRLRSEAGGP